MSKISHFFLAAVVCTLVSCSKVSEQQIVPEEASTSSSLQVPLGSGAQLIAAASYKIKGSHVVQFEEEEGSCTALVRESLSNQHYVLPVRFLAGYKLADLAKESSLLQSKRIEVIFPNKTKEVEGCVVGSKLYFQIKPRK